MNFFENIKFDNRSIMAIVTLICGLVLLLFPIQSLSVATRTIAFVLVIGATINIVKFVLNKGEKLSGDYFYLILSILAIGVAISIFSNPTWIIAVINIVVGIILIVNGLGNLSSTIKIRVNDTSWWMFSIVPIITLVIGFIIIVNPVGMAAIITRIEGISLILDGISTWIISYRVDKFVS